MELLGGAIGFEEAREICRKQDKVNEQVKSDRTVLERKWQDYQDAAFHGEILIPGVSKLVTIYTTPQDNNFGTYVRQASADRREFMNDDKWFRLVPDGHWWTDLTLADAVGEWIMDMKQNSHSNYMRVMEQADLQMGIFNLGVYHYCWYRYAKQQYERRTISINGKQQIKVVPGQSKIEYQGGLWSFVDARNFYLNTQAPRYDDIRKLDKWHREAVRYSDVLIDPRFNPEVQPDTEYANPDGLIYRNITGMDELDGKHYERSKMEEKGARFSKAGSSDSGQNSIIKDYTELRTCYLKQLKLKSGTILNEVCIIYAKHGDNIVPLLIEQYRKDPFYCWKHLEDPYDPYGQSEAALSYNDHAKAAYHNGLIDFFTGEIVFKKRFIPMSLRESLNLSDEEYQVRMNTPAAMIEYDDLSDSEDGGYQHNSNKIFSIEEKDELAKLNVLQQAVGKNQADMQNAQASLQSANGSDVTATFTKYINSKKDAIANAYTTKYLDQVVKPNILDLLDDAKLFLDPQRVSRPINELDRKRLEKKGMSVEEIEKYQAQTGEPWRETYQAFIPGLNGQNVDAGFDISYNAATEQKEFTITKFILSGFAANIRFEFNRNFNNRMQIAEDMIRLAEFGQSIDDPIAKYEWFLAICSRILTVWNDPQMTVFQDVFKKRMEALAQQQQQAAQAQAQQAESQTLVNQNKAQKDAAQSQVMEANAAKTNQEVQINNAAANLVTQGGLVA